MILFLPILSQIALALTSTPADDSAPNEPDLYDQFMSKFEKATSEIVDFETHKLAKMSKLTPLEAVAFLEDIPEKSRQAETLLFLDRARPVLLADAFDTRAATLAAILHDWTNAKKICRDALAPVKIRLSVKKDMIKTLISQIAGVAVKQRHIHNYNMAAYDELENLRSKAVRALEISEADTSDLADFIEAATAADRYIAKTKKIYWTYAKAMLQSARDNAMFLGLSLILIGACFRFATVEIFWFALLLCVGSLLCTLSSGLHLWTRLKS